jgi:hypothetical protein
VGSCMTGGRSGVRHDPEKREGVARCKSSPKEMTLRRHDTDTTELWSAGGGAKESTSCASPRTFSRACSRRKRVARVSHRR